MSRALKLARKAAGRPSCEPLAGAVVVSSGRIVGRGFAGSRKQNSADDASATSIALADAGPLARGATLYTNISPGADCQDRAACIARLIAARPGRVVVGINDETGVTGELKRAGIEVSTGVSEQECLEVNEIYFKYASTGLPFVTVKFAQSLDGRIATGTGNSQWISSPASLRLAHQLRREHDAIMVGIGTVLADDPRLTVRLVNGRDPLRVVVDSRLRIPLTARVLAGDAARHTLVATTQGSDLARISGLEKLGARVMVFPPVAGGTGLRISDLLASLGRARVASVLVEGGAGIITSLLAAHHVDRLVIAIAPKIIGRGIEAVGDLGVATLNEALTFSSFKTRRLGPDIIFDGRLQREG